MSFSAMEGHLQRFETTDAGYDNDKRDREIGASLTQVLVSWWHQFHPLVVHCAQDFGSILELFLTPITPRAARQAGFRRASINVLRSLDGIDAALPGVERDWSSRWRGCCQGGRRTAFPGRHTSVCSAFGDAGLLAVVLVVVAAAVSWCSWRRSPPSWPLLLGEAGVVSAGVAHYLAREDGHKEAKLLEVHLLALERSLGPFFRGVYACMRMIRCSQTLSFGLRLSVPMPPVARMEGRLAGGGENSQVGRSELALPELRAVLLDVLQRGVAQAIGFQTRGECNRTVKVDDAGELISEGLKNSPGNSRAPHFLADLTHGKKELVAGLRRFVADMYATVSGVLMEPSVWGLWWDSQIAEVSESVRELAEYFEAAGSRLEKAIGSGGLKYSDSCGASHNSEMRAAAEALSSLRLHYEEIIVRLYSCQSNASRIMRDPAKNTEELWGVVRQGLVDARLSAGPSTCDHELWRKAEDLVESRFAEVGQRGADWTPGDRSAEHVSDNSPHLEAGVGWVSLSTPRQEDPRVFEDGSGDEGASGKLQTPTSNTRVTDVLVGVPSPCRNRSEGDPDATSTSTHDDMVKERSRAQLVGELHSVLRARPPPQTCEKCLPLESQQSLRFDDSDEEQDVGQLAGLSTPPKAPFLPVAQSMGSRKLMSELQAQLSLAANEDICSAMSSDDKEDHVLIGGDKGKCDDHVGKSGM